MVDDKMGIVTNSQTNKNKQSTHTHSAMRPHLFLQEETEKKWKSQDQASKWSKTPAICYEEMLKPLSDSLYSYFRNKLNNWLWKHLSSLPGGLS